MAESTTSSVCDEEPRGLQAHDDVLARDDLGRALADARAAAHAPDVDLPCGEILGHVELDLGEPSASVSRLPTQRAVSANSCRTVGSTTARRRRRRRRPSSAIRRRRGHWRPSVRRRRHRHARARCQAATGRRRRRAMPFGPGMPFIRLPGLPIAVAKRAEVLHLRFRSAWPPAPSPRSRFVSLCGLMAAAPLPEELADVAGGDAAGDVVERLVVNRDDRRARRAACRRGRSA